MGGLNYGPGDKTVHAWMEHEEKRLKLLNILIGKYGEKPVEDECFKVDTFVSLDPDCLRFPKQKWLKPIRNPDTKEIFRYEDLNGEEYHVRDNKWVYKPKPLSYRSNVGRGYESRR